MGVLSENIIIGASGAGAAPVEISHTATYGQGGSSPNTTVTLTSISIGTASADRLVVGAFGISGGLANTSSTSATIGGNAATKIVEAVSGDATITSIYSYGLATGTTATFTITYANALNHMTFNAFAIYNANHTATDSFGSTADVGTGTIDIAAGGVALGEAVTVSTGGSTYTWVGLTEVMEDTSVSSYPTLSYSAAMDEFEDEQSGRTVSVTRSALAWESLCVASFEPA